MIKMASYKKKNNKGVALILALGFASVLFTLSIGYVGSAITESNLCQRQQDAVVALYEAERGAAYAFVEAQNAGYNWFTHNVDIKDGNELKPSGTLTTDSLSLKGPGSNTPIAVIDGSGSYTFSSGAATIEARVYSDPNNPNKAYILSRATVGTRSRIIKTELTRRSLYHYFYYYPWGKSFESMDFDGEGKGGIYVNGTIVLANTDFRNITELSTNSRSPILARYNRYSPPYSLDYILGTWGVTDGKSPLPSVYQSGKLVPSRSYNGSNPWQAWNWPDQWWPPYDWMPVAQHFNSPGSVNGVNVPSQLGTPWDWERYTKWSNDASEENRITNEKGVRFCNPCGDINGDGIDDTKFADASYWETLSERLCGSGQKNNECGRIDPDFWSDKTYNRTSRAETESVKYLNTEYQAGDWNNWLEGSGSVLKGVVKEASSGGYDTAMPNIETNYSQSAKEKGLYIGLNDSGSLEVYLNGKKSAALPSCIEDNKKFFNTVRPQDKDKDGNVDPENILEIDIGKCINSGEVPENGIAYVTYKNLRLVNAKQLPDKGMTVVSPYNIYIKGNYNSDPSKTQAENDDNWRPASVISNSFVYILSDKFNDPQTLPDYVNPREYPYEKEQIAKNKITQDSIKRAELAKEIKSFFGLKNFDIENYNGTGKPPADEYQLQDMIRSQYNTECKDTMPNQASPTTVRSAIVSSKDLSSPSYYTDDFYHLERWSSAPVIQGAFIRMGNSWANDKAGNPIQDIPATYWGKRRGGPNSWGWNPKNINKQDPRIHINRLGRLYFRYETNFADNTKLPPGNLSAGTQSSWQEVSDFNHG